MIGVGIGGNLPHTVEVWRESTSVANGVSTHTGPTQVVASMSCLIESMGAWRQQTILGNLSGYRYHITWQGQQLRDDDQILWNSRWFALKLNADDTMRDPMTTSIEPYFSGYLEESVDPRV